MTTRISDTTGNPTTFYDVKSIRSFGVTYTNPSSTHYMVVYICARCTTATGNTDLFLNDVNIGYEEFTQSWYHDRMIVVPPGNTYRVVSNCNTLAYWFELRE